MKDFYQQKIFLTPKKLTSMLGWRLFIPDFNILAQKAFNPLSLPTAGLLHKDKRESNKLDKWLRSKKKKCYFNAARFTLGAQQQNIQQPDYCSRNKYD